MSSIQSYLENTTFIVTVLNILFIVFILLGALIGFIRGRRKAIYWFVVTLIIVVGSWIVFPYIFKALCAVDWTTYGINYEIQVTEGSTVPLTSINETLKIIIERLIEVEEGQDVTTTQTYALALALVEMAVRVVFILLVLILNWTLFKLIFLIVYLFIRPKKRDDYGVKKKASPLNRLTGSAVGLFNAIFIFFILSVPFAGIFSIADSAAGFAEYAKTSDKGEENETQDMARIAYRGEIIRLDSDSEGGEMLDYFLDNAQAYASIYRTSAAGKLFSIKVGGTEIDNRAFDGLISVNVDGEKVSIRKEIIAVSNAASILLGKIGKPLVENDFKMTPELLKYIDGDLITSAFNELSNLKIIDMVVPAGIELLPVVMKDNDNLETYVSLKELSKQMKDVDFGKAIGEIGEFSGNLFNLFFDKEFTILDILDEEHKIDKNKIIDRIFDIDDTKIDALFDSLANVNIIDALNESIVVAGDKALSKLTENMLLLKPVVSVDDDGYLIIDGIKSNYLAPKAPKEGTDGENPELELNPAIDDYTYKLSEQGFWIVNDFETNVNGLENSFSISLKDVKLTDEIRNLAPIVKALINMDLKSITDISKQIENKELTFSTEKFTYENVDQLFSAIFNSKIVSNNKTNIEVIVKNMIPNDFRSAIKLRDIEANDLTSVLMAAKVLYDSGVVNALLKENGLDEIDLELVVKDYGDKFVDELLSSKLIGENITPVLSAVITISLGKDVFVIPDIDWNNQGKKELKSVLDVLATALKYKSKFTDFKSLEVEDITEILDKIKNNLSDSEIIKQNMNNLINFLNNQQFMKDAGFELKPLDNPEDWTEEEISNLIEGVKIIIVTVKDNDTESGINIYKIFNLTDDEIDEICKSEFTRKTVVATLYKFIRGDEKADGEDEKSNSLSDTIVLNIEEDDPKWDYELGYFLKALTRLFKGIDDFENGDITKKVVSNLSSFSNDINDPNDDVSKILNSTVLVDSFAKIITNLADQSDGLLKVVEPIEWNDYTESGSKKAGEIRLLVRAIKILSGDKGGDYLMDTLTGGETKDIVNTFLDTSDSDVEEILASKIFIDTLKEFIIKYSKEDTEEDRKAYIYLKNENMTNEEWRSELIDIIKAGRILLVEEVDDEDNPGQKKKTVNLDKFTKGDTAETLDMLANIADSDIKYITKSTILVDSIAKIVIDLTKESDDIKISDAYNNEGKTWDDAFTSMWRSEIERLIKATKAIVFDKDGKSLAKNITSGDNNDLLELLLNLKDNDEKISSVLDSDIFYETIKYQINKLTEEKDGKEAIISMPTGADAQENWSRDDWKTELKATIYAIDKLLTEEKVNPETGLTERKANIDKLSSEDADSLLQLIVDLTDEELDKVLESKIITATISVQIKKLGDDDGDRLINTDSTTDFTLNDWRSEVKKIVKSLELLVVEDGKVNTEKLKDSETDKILQMIADLKDGTDPITGEYVEANDEIKVVLASVIIVDTISEKIIDMSDEENAVVTIKDDIRGTENVPGLTQDEWRTEIRSIIKSVNILLTDDEGKVSTAKLNSGKTDDLLQLICDLSDDEISDVLESMIITDTISNKIIELGEDKDNEKAIIKIKADVKNHDSDLDYGRGYWKAEIERIIKSAKLLLTDDEGKVSTAKLDSGKTDDLLQLICDLEDSEVNKVVQSEVITDTIASKIIELGEDKDNEKAIIKIKDDIKNHDNDLDKGRSYWRLEIARIIKSAKLLLTDDEGKVSTAKLDSGKTDDMLQLICDLEDSEISKVLESDVISDTISSKIVELGEDKDTEKAVITIKADIKAHDNDLDYGRSYWRTEIAKIIKSAKLLLTDDEGKVSTAKLDSGKTDDLLQLICDLEDDEVSKVVESEVIVDTISKKIVELGEDKDTEKAIITIKADVKAHDNDLDYGRGYWRIEIARIIKSAKLMLADDEGKVSTAKLDSGKTDDLLQLICDLEDDEVSKVVESEVITDTISKKIVELGEDKDTEKAIITIKADVKAHDNDDDYGRTYWRAEIAKIIKSAKLLLTDDEGKVSTAKLDSGKTDDLLQLICDLEDDEVSKVVESEVITDTISKKIVELGEDKDTEKAIITIKADVKAHDNDLDYGRGYWRIEIARIIKSAKLMLTDDEGKVSTAKLDSGKTDDLLQLICDLEDSEVNKVVESDVIVDTISKKIVELGEDKGTEKAVLEIKADVKAHDNDDDYGRSYWRVEVERIIKATKLMLTDENGNVDSSALSSGDTNKILKLISDLNDGYDELHNYNAANDEIQKVVASDVICDTIAKKIVDLGLDENGNIDPSKTVNVTNVYGYTRSEWRGSGADGGEIKKIIKATNILLVEEVDDENNPGQKKKTVNISKITDSNDDELVELICNMTDEEADEVVKSTLITDTIAKQIKSFDNTLTISNDVKAYTTDEWRVEIVALIKSSRLVVAEQDVNGKYIVNMEKVRGDSNYVVNNIVNLKNEINDPNDEFGVAISSVIIRDTIIDKIEAQSKEKGGMLVISNDVVWTDTKEGDLITSAGELRRIFKSLKLIFEEDDPLNPGQKKVNIDLAKLSANDVLTRTKRLDSKPGEDGDEIGIVLESKIICETIIDSTITESEKPGATIIVRYNKDSSEWYDTYNSGVFTKAGELRKLLVDLKYLFKNEDVIDMNEFKIDNMLELDDSELEDVFNSTIILDTFYSEIDKQASKPNAVLAIEEGTVKDSEEAVKFVKAIKIVKGEKSITTIDSSQFNLDEFINNKSDAELEILFASHILRYSASLKVHENMTGTGSLKAYIELDVDFDGNPITGTASEIKAQQVAMIELDIINLVKVIRDLKKDCNIDYNAGFTFASFEASAKPDPSEPDSTENADRISDTLAKSQLIVHSLPKMIREMLSGSLSVEQMSSINTNMVTETRNFWLNYDINGNGIIENITIDPDNNVYDETGELRKIIRILTNIDLFAKDTGDVFSSKTDKNEITKPLLLINNSLVLNGLIPEFSETALSNISDWLYSPRSVLTKVMWDSEIDNLGDIIIQINEGGLGNLSGLDVKTVNTTELSKLLKLVNKSRIIDISHIEDKVEVAVNNTFDTDVSVNSVYTGSDYDEKVSAWNAEIDKLIIALDKLQEIDDTSISGANGKANAAKIGRFLDACRDTTMLHNIVSDVCTSVLTKNGVNPAVLALAGIDLDAIESYEVTLQQIADLL